MTRHVITLTITGEELTPRDIERLEHDLVSAAYWDTGVQHVEATSKEEPDND